MCGYKITSLTSVCFFVGLLTACTSREPSIVEAHSSESARTLTLAAYTTPREVYGTRILPAFSKMWNEKTGENIKFRESYMGSGAQSRAVVAGFEADVVALSLEPDIRRLEEAGLITHNWKAGPNRGIVSRSVVVFGVRKGNPRRIQAWDDLCQKDLRVLTPNVKTSGGAMWNIVAAYGAVKRGHTERPRNDDSAEALLSDILGNVFIMDKGARESMLTFEQGAGEVILTYENEMRVAAKAGRTNEYVIPPSTVLIENPAAVVDTYAEKHGALDIAHAFVDFLATPEVQLLYAEYGLRPATTGIESGAMAGFPNLGDVSTIDGLGGWEAISHRLFARGAMYDRAMERSGEPR